MSNLWLNLRVLYWHLQWARGDVLPRIRFNPYHWRYATAADPRVQLYQLRWPWHA